MRGKVWHIPSKQLNVLGRLTLMRMRSDCTAKALALLPEDHPQRFDLLAGRAAVYNMMAARDAQLGDIEAMVMLANKQGDKSRQVDGLLSLANLYLETETEKAREPLQLALDTARELGDVGREGRALYNFGKQAVYYFEYYKAREYFETSADRLQQAGILGEFAECMSFLSVALGDLGDSPRRSVRLKKQPR